MAIYLTELDPFNVEFPSVFDALEEPSGLLAFGGDLSPKRLLTAYRSGIFPWYGLMSLYYGGACTTCCV
ncbi:leucyl/phenylalanyl-tRNA-protein transferase [Vibrio astriarenae]|nr:leucyl/phenylalanyl-tRNA-protein transferase [Vibrio sp. C7]